MGFCLKPGFKLSLTLRPVARTQPGNMKAPSRSEVDDYPFNGRSFGARALAVEHGLYGGVKIADTNPHAAPTGKVFSHCIVTAAAVGTTTGGDFPLTSLTMPVGARIPLFQSTQLTLASGSVLAIYAPAS